MEDGRTQRVNELLYVSLGELLRRRFAREAVAITLTKVDTTPDLRHADVYYSVMTDDKASAVSFFRKNVGEISRLFAQDVVLKRHPKLHFIFDDSLRNMAAVDRILREDELKAQADVMRAAKSGAKGGKAPRGDAAPKRRATPKRKPGSAARQSEDSE